MIRVFGYILPAVFLLASAGITHAGTREHCNTLARELTLTAWNEILPDMSAIAAP